MRSSVIISISRINPDFLRAFRCYNVRVPWVGRPCRSYIEVSSLSERESMCHPGTKGFHFVMSLWRSEICRQFHKADVKSTHWDYPLKKTLINLTGARTLDQTPSVERRRQSPEVSQRNDLQAGDPQAVRVMGCRRPSIMLRCTSMIANGVGMQGVDRNFHASRCLNLSTDSELERRAMSGLSISPASLLAIIFNRNGHDA